eukprot:g28396.t1
MVQTWFSVNTNDMPRPVLRGGNLFREGEPFINATSTVDIVTNLWTPVISFKEQEAENENLAALDEKKRVITRVEMPPPPRCLDSSRAKLSTESGAKFTKHVYARMVMALEDEHFRASFMEACQTPSRCDLDAGNVGMNGFYQELNLLIADPEFQPEITVPTAATSDAQMIEDGESQELLAVFPTVSLLEMKLTELQPADISTIPARGFPIDKIKEKFLNLRKMLNILISAKKGTQGKYQQSGQAQPDISGFLHNISKSFSDQQICYLFWWVNGLKDDFTSSLLSVVPEVNNELTNPAEAGPTSLPSTRRGDKRSTESLVKDLLVEHKARAAKKPLHDEYSAAEASLERAEKRLEHASQDSTQRSKLLEKVEYWQAKVDEVFEKIRDQDKADKAAATKRSIKT